MSKHDTLRRLASTSTLAFAAFASMTCFCAPASAQGLFEFLFGRLIDHAVAPQLSTESIGSARYSGPAAGLPLRSDTRRVPSRTVAYCVRLCDGRYFPVQRTRETTPAELCDALCPTTPTKIVLGDGIDQATASDGTSYAALNNAFVYRQRIMTGCTCNGSRPLGLEAIDVEADPTLRAGDAIVTARGVMIVKNGTAGRATFTPVVARLGRLTDIRQVLALHKFAKQ